MGSFTTRRSHLNLLWIHNVLSTPMIYKLCRFISRSNMENLKPTPRVTFETRGLRWHDSANLASFSKFKNPRTMEGKITRSRRLLLFQGRQKISGLESIWQLQNPGSMKKIRVIRKDSGLKSGSREVSLTEDLKYPVYNPVQGKYILPQSSQTLKSGLKMSGSKRN